MSFRFEGLTVYKESLQFFSDIHITVSHWPTLYRYNLSDQLLRAALSISLNIAEGSSRTPKDFQHFLVISRGSCYECLAILTAAHNLCLVTDREYDSYRGVLEHIAKMLTALKNTL